MHSTIEFGLGVYIATHNSPVFLRFCLAQLTLQRLLPEFAVVHQNGFAERYDWAVDDITDSLAVRFQFLYSPQPLAHPEFHRPALQRLVDLGCEQFTKWDHDDIFFRNHLESLVYSRYDADCVISSKADVLEMYPGRLPKLRRNMEWTWNPTGGMSDGVLFNRRFAERYLELMSQPESAGVPDDVLMGQVMAQPDITVRRIVAKTLCYVSHGRNTSGPIIDNPLYQEAVNAIV